MHQEKIINFYKKYSAVFLIIGIGIVLRLIRLWDLFHFTYDEEVFAFVGKRMFVNGHVPLIGGVTPFHFHLAPYFYWLSGVFLYLSKLNPIGWGIVAALIAGCTMGVLYFTTAKLFNRTTAFIATILYSFSFYQNIFDRHYWGLIFDGLIAVSTYFCLHQIIRGKSKYLLVLAGLLAFGIHADPTVLALIVFAFLSFIVFRPAPPKKIIIWASIIFFISFIPLVIFDLRHDFANSRGIMQYINEIQSKKSGNISYSLIDTLLYVPRALSRTLYVAGNTDLARQYSYCPQHAISRLAEVPPIFVIGIVCLCWFVWNKRKEFKNPQSVTLLLLAFIATYIGTILYGVIFRGDLFDHYMAILFPLFFILVALWCTQLIKRFPHAVIVLLILFVAVNVSQILHVVHRFGYADKIQAVQWAIAQTGTKDFSLDVISSCFAYNGYRYLFYVYGKEPVKSYVDANFTHLYDKPPAEKHPPYLVIITNPDFQETPQYEKEYTAYKQKTLQSAQFGNIEVLIIDNTAHDFVGKF